MIDDGRFEVRLARDPQERQAAQALRYRVFVEELGGDGPGVDHKTGLERDAYDAHCEHLVLLDRGGAVLGTCRILEAEGAARAGGFYSAQEFDLAPLVSDGRRLMELGRACVAPEIRGTAAMTRLFAGLAGIVQAKGSDILFGAASFAGTDPVRHADPLSLLNARYLAPPDLRPCARAPAVPLDQVPPDRIDRRRAMAEMPPLLKAYLRLGAMVGAGAHVDAAFGTLDVCMVLPVTAIPVARRAHYGVGTSA